MFGKKGRTFPRPLLLLSLTAILWAGPVHAFDDGPVVALKAKYTITQTTMNREQITQPGVVMAIVANGISSVPWDWPLGFDNPVSDGKVEQQSRWKEIGRGKNLKILQPGDKVYVTKIESKQDNKNDLLKMSVLSVDEMDTALGGKKRYAATISFKLAKNALSETPPDQLQTIVEAVLKPDAGDQGSSNNTASSLAPAATPAAATPAAAAAPAPPQPPPAATQNISLGQTIDQVVATMGQPQQIIDLGSRKTYKYPDMKIIFVNGKVSDVQ